MSPGALCPNRPPARAPRRSVAPSSRALRAFVALACSLAGCVAASPLHHQPHQAVTVANRSITADICHVRGRELGDTTWHEIGPIDPIAPGRSRTLRVAHGRWRFRFQRCESSRVIDAPMLDVGFDPVVFMLCDGVCHDEDVPNGATVLRHDSRSDGWGISAPVYQPTGRRRARVVL